MTENDIWGLAVGDRVDYLGKRGTIASMDEDGWLTINWDGEPPVRFEGDIEMPWDPMLARGLSVVDRLAELA